MKEREKERKERENELKAVILLTKVILITVMNREEIDIEIEERSLLEMSTLLQRKAVSSFVL